MGLRSHARDAAMTPPPRETVRRLQPVRHPPELPKLDEDGVREQLMTIARDLSRVYDQERTRSETGAGIARRERQSSKSRTSR